MDDRKKLYVPATLMITAYFVGILIGIPFGYVLHGDVDMTKRRSAEGLTGFALALVAPVVRGFR